MTPQALTEAVKEMCDDNPALFDGYYSYWETEQGDRALMLMLQVFCFGFIILMTLICTANIMNTISTGIDLRRPGAGDVKIRRHDAKDI